MEQDLSISAAAKQMFSASNSSATAEEKTNKDTKSLVQSLHATDKSSQKIDNMFNQMKQLREKPKDMEKKFAEASLQAKSPETSSPSNPSPQYNYISQRGRGRYFQRGSQSRGRGLL